LRRWLSRLGRAVLGALLLLLVILVSEIVAGWRCNLQGQISPPVPSPSNRKAATAGIPGYARPEDDTLLSYPEWYIVWSYQEKADYQQTHLPSGFPYFAAARQYWSSYCCISRLIRGKYSFNVGEQVMLVVIGSSFSVEYILKGLYEKTVGRLSEWTAHNEPTAEDQFASHVAREYADFVHVRPFYEFHFARQVPSLWRETPLWDAHPLRKWERKLFLTADYAIEAFYCWLIEKMTHLTYGSEPGVTYAWIEGGDNTALRLMLHVTLVKQVGDAAWVVGIPRYQEFTAVATSLSLQGMQFVEIAGNSQIVISVLAQQGWHYSDSDAQPLFSTPVLTDPQRQRVVLLCSVASLSGVLRAMPQGAASVEHVYDY
jgi:hypothetical protein